MSKTLPPLPPARSITKLMAQMDGSLFERRPVKLDGFTLRARSAVPVGKPSIKQWQAAFEFASASEEASPYWVADLLAYSETRADWKEKISQAMSVTGLAKQTLENLAIVGRHVAEPERVLSPSISHTLEVVSLPRVEQTKLLEAARDNGWTTRELRHAVKATKRSKVLDGRADGFFTVEVTVLVDVEAQNSIKAQETAWDKIKRAVQDMKGAKVIASHARKEVISA